MATRLIEIIIAFLFATASLFSCAKCANESIPVVLWHGMGELVLDLSHEKT